MIVETVIVGELYTNCYILKKEGCALVIDPGDNFDKIKRALDNNKLLGIIITHYHFDHIGALKKFRNNYDVKVYDYSNMSEKKNKIGPFNFEVIYTPGHKEDLISIYFEKENMLFCGDFIFRGSIGRYDFSDSSFDEMKKSIKKILSYPDSMTIYPGHGQKTDLKSETEILKYYLDL